jgi:orotate phosphoribosyltransferase
VAQINPTAQNLRSTLARLIEERALFLGEFKSPSGGRSDYYIDMAMIFTEPTGLEIAINLTLNELEKLSVDKIASPSVEADPIVAVVGMHAKIGSLFIHQGEPIYAYEKLENLLSKGKRVVIIADVTLSGNTVLSAAKTLRSAGAEVRTAITLVDLEKGARNLLEGNGIKFVPLVEAKDISLPGKPRKDLTTK